MSKYYKLYEFTYKLIDAQIKKYLALADFGIGPDARMNATLVLEEVKELLGLANQLISIMASVPDDEKNELQFLSIFNQVRFYVEQENNRAHAGWLIDENNIHSGVYNRTKAQLEEIKLLALAANVDINTPAKPTTDVQKQCEHDSAAIAHKILSLAMLMRADPQADLAKFKLKDHAEKILRGHASTPDSRYFRHEFATPITTLHPIYKQFLETSPLKTTESQLSKETSLAMSVEHRKQQSNLLALYKMINPASDLFAEEKKPQPVTTKYGLFAITVASAATLTIMYWLYQFIAQTESPSFTSQPN